MTKVEEARILIAKIMEILPQEARDRVEQALRSRMSGKKLKALMERELLALKADIRSRSDTPPPPSLH